MAKKVKVKKTTTLKKVGKNSDIPATHGQLEAVRAELKSEITSLSLKMESMEKSIDSKLEKITASIHHQTSLFEEQNSQNKFAMDKLEGKPFESKSLRKPLSELINIKTSFSRKDLRPIKR